MTQVPAAPVLALMALGVLLAIIGSAAKSTTLQVAGLAMLFLATAAMVIGGLIAFDVNPRDPRPRGTPGSAAGTYA